MRSLMLRLLTIILVSSSFLSAQTTKTTESKLITFINKAISTGRGYKFIKAEILYKENVPSMKNWKAYFLKIDLKIPNKKKNISVRDIMFSNGFVISKDLININSGKSIKSSFLPPVSAKLYDSKHLLIGNKDAKNKMIIFSDPLCPFCMEYVPGLIRFVKNHENQFALYYYNFPLSIHPGSVTLVKTMLVAKKLGLVKNLETKVYSEAFDFKKSDEASVLEKFNKVFKTHITKDQINSKDILDRVKNDIKVANNLMVSGTPTLYVNGKKDPSRSLYKKIAEEKK